MTPALLICFFSIFRSITDDRVDATDQQSWIHNIRKKCHQNYVQPNCGLTLYEDDSVELICQNCIEWEKEGGCHGGRRDCAQLTENSKGIAYYFQQGRTTIFRIKSLSKENEGLYKCINENNKQECSVQIQLSEKDDKIKIATSIGASIFGSIFVLAAIFTALYYYLKTKRQDKTIKFNFVVELKSCFGITKTKRRLTAILDWKEENKQNAKKKRNKEKSVEIHSKREKQGKKPFMNNRKQDKFKQSKKPFKSAPSPKSAAVAKRDSKDKNENTNLKEARIKNKPIVLNTNNKDFETVIEIANTKATGGEKKSVTHQRQFCRIL